MKTYWGAPLLIGLAFGAGPALAEEQGTLGLAPDMSWAQPLGEPDLGDHRGGFNGLAFSVFFSGGFDQEGNAEAQFSAATNGVETEPSAEVSVDGGDVNVLTHIGELGGANGIFQIAQVPGDFNVVHNNLFIEIHLYTGGELPDLFGPALTGLLD